MAKNIYHADIKPENFVLDKTTGWKTYSLKVIDFGVSTIEKFEKLKGLSEDYVPQQIVAKNKQLSNSQKADVRFFESKQDREKYEYY